MRRWRNKTVLRKQTPRAKAFREGARFAPPFSYRERKRNRGKCEISRPALFRSFYQNKHRGRRGGRTTTTGVLRTERRFRLLFPSSSPCLSKCNGIRLSNYRLVDLFTSGCSMERRRIAAEEGRMGSQ